jgi:thiol:disulfide interchange protein DsbD
MKATLVLVVLLCTALVGGASAQGLGDSLFGGGRTEGGDLGETALQPPQQGAGGTVLVVAEVRPAEGYKVGQNTVELSVESDLALQAGDLFLRHEGRRLPADQEYVEGEFEAVLPVTLPDEVEPGEYELTATAQFVPCTLDAAICLRPREAARRLTLTVTDEPAAVVDIPEAPAPGQAGPAEQDVAGDEDPFAGRSVAVAVLVAFLVGFALLLTPCVYPLIPVTIALVGATSERSWLQGLVHSLVYVLGISVTYAVAGGVAGATGEFFSWLQHPAVSIVLALIFVAMALAMFDVFTVDFSSQRLQRARARLQGRGGLAGLFVIGILTGVGATACLAPVITGALAYVAERGSPMLGGAMFFAMAWGFGLPLVVLGTFSGLAKAAPKPGEWMNVVKHVLGLALLGVAVYYVGKSGLLSDNAFRVLLAGFLLAAGVFVGAFDRLLFEDGWYRRARKAAGLLLVAAAVVVFAGPYLARMAAGPAARAQIEWMELEPGAEVEFVAEANSPVLVYYWTEDCDACKKMSRTTHRDPAVVAESDRFVFARVDMSDVEAESEVGRRFLEEYKAPGYPVTALYNTEGELDRVLIGYVGPERMLQELKTVE